MNLRLSFRPGVLWTHNNHLQVGPMQLSWEIVGLRHRQAGMARIFFHVLSSDGYMPSLLAFTLEWGWLRGPWVVDNGPDAAMLYSDCGHSLGTLFQCWWDTKMNSLWSPWVSLMRWFAAPQFSGLRTIPFISVSGSCQQRQLLMGRMVSQNSACIPLSKYIPTIFFVGGSARWWFWVLALGPSYESGFSHCFSVGFMPWKRSLTFTPPSLKWGQ